MLTLPDGARGGYDMPSLNPTQNGEKDRPKDVSTIFGEAVTDSLVLSFENALCMGFETTEDLMVATAPDTVLRGPRLCETQYNPDLEAIAEDFLLTLFDVVADSSLVQQFVFLLTDQEAHKNLIVGPIVKPEGKDENGEELLGLYGARIVYKDTRNNTLIVFNTDHNYPPQTQLFISAPNKITGSPRHMFSHLRLTDPENDDCLDSVKGFYPGCIDAKFEGEELILQFEDRRQIVFDFDRYTRDDEYELFVETEIQPSKPNDLIARL